MCSVPLWRQQQRIKTVSRKNALTICRRMKNTRPSPAALLFNA